MPTSLTRTASPAYPEDLYSTSAILDPYPHYQRLRDLGPVLWLSRHKVYALPRYAEAKAALLDDKTFRSGDGVALNPLTNRLSRGTTLNSDDKVHSQRRGLAAHRLTPRALGLGDSRLVGGPGTPGDRVLPDRRAPRAVMNTLDQVPA